MGKKSVIKATKISLNITFIVFITLFIAGILTNLYNPEMIKMNRTLNLIFTMLVGIVVIYIINILKNIVKTVESNEPFCKKNIQRFIGIGYLIFFIGLLDTIKRFPLYKTKGIVATPYGGIGEFFFIYLLLGFLALLLSEIFNQAIEIKNENDMTI